VLRDPRKGCAQTCAPPAFSPSQSAVYAHTHTHSHTHTHNCVCVCVHVRMCVRACICACVRASMCGVYMHAIVYVCM